MAPGLLSSHKWGEGGGMTSYQWVLFEIGVPPKSNSISFSHP